MMLKSVTPENIAQTWRSLRRGAHGLLTQQSCREHLIVQHAESLQLANELLTQPEVCGLQSIHSNLLTALIRASSTASGASPSP